MKRFGKVQQFYTAQADLARAAHDLNTQLPERSVPIATETHRVRDVDSVNMCRSFSDWLVLWWKEHGIGRGAR